MPSPVLLGREDWTKRKSGPKGERGDEQRGKEPISWLIRGVRAFSWVIDGGRNRRDPRRKDGREVEERAHARGEIEFLLALRNEKDNAAAHDKRFIAASY